jgi:ubiquinone/menaquinone biosynthesis C-methylase UbiE
LPVQTKPRRRDLKTSGSKYWFQVNYLRKSRSILQRYRATKPWLDQLYATFFNVRPGMRIVDVGCGTGDFTRYLAKLSKGKSTIVGIDSNEEGIAAAVGDTKKSRFPKMIAYKVGDAYNIPLNDRYADLTCCRSLLIHLSDPVKAVKEMTRVTKIGGAVAAVEGGKLNEFFDPNDESYTKLAKRAYEAWLAGFRRLENKELRIGERLPGIFRAAGLSNVRVEVEADAWMYSDPRRRLAEIKEEIRFDLSMLKERLKTDKKYYRAGGMTEARINRYNRQTISKMRALLSDDKKLRSDPSLQLASLFLVSGIRTI